MDRRGLVCSACFVISFGGCRRRLSCFKTYLTNPDQQWPHFHFAFKRLRKTIPYSLNALSKMHLLKWSAAVALGAGGRRDSNLHFISGRPPKQCNLPSAWREREEPDEDGIVTGLRDRETEQQCYTRFLLTKPGRTVTSFKSCESPRWLQICFWIAVLDHILTSRRKCSDVSLSLLLMPPPKERKSNFNNQVPKTKIYFFITLNKKININ